MKDVLNLNIPSDSILKGAKVFDMTGKEVNVNLSNNQLNMSKLPKGVYLVKFETDKGTIVKKVVKK